MLNALKAIAAVYGLAFLTWVFFSALMNAKRVRNANEIRPAVYAFAYPALGLGYLLDFSLQMVSTLVFLELPHELLLSTRIQRLVDTESATWRGKLALWVRMNFLDNFDPAGVHRG